MDRESTWSAEVEKITLAHLLKTPVVSYLTEHANWNSYTPSVVDRTLDDDVHLPKE